jgi:hypothetical protein
MVMEHLGKLFFNKYDVFYTLVNHDFPRRRATVVANNREQVRELLVDYWAPFDCHVGEVVFLKVDPIQPTVVSESTVDDGGETDVI